jgi:cobalt-zinc-cadmium efflux system protein
VAHAHSHAPDHGHARGHGHGNGLSEGTQLKVALGLTLAVAALELAGGLLSGSLALLSDSAHVFMDAFALGIALAASIGATRPATVRHTFGYARVEVLAALLNGGLLFAVTILIAIEAVHRLAAPELPQGGLMAGVAAAGFAANLTIGLMLLRGARENLNLKAALFHVASDAVGALAVVAGGIAVLVLRIAWIDPALSLLVAALIVVGVVRIVREAADVLLEGAPDHAAVPLVRKRICEQPGVVDVHDLHVWTIGSGAYALSAHVLLADTRISEASAILRGIEARLRGEFAISHVTVQFECESCADDERIVCTQRRRTEVSG